MRTQLDEQLLRLNKEMVAMGSAIEQSIVKVCVLLKAKDDEAASKLREEDAVVDRMEKEIESLCLRIILMQQPVAKDLRKVSAALKMITDMERIGDQAADIAEILMMPVEGELMERPVHLDQMGAEAANMVHKAIDAYVKHDLALAQAVQADDDKVDALFVKVKHELLEDMKNRPDPGMQLLDTLMIAKYLERIGDHAVNIAEWVEYAVNGTYKGEKLG